MFLLTVYLTAPPNYGSNCDPSRFNEIGQGIPQDEAICDCGCGAWDPDCLYTKNVSIVCSPTGAVITPGTFTCSPSTFLCIPVANPDFEGPDVDYDEVDNGSNPDRPGGATCDCGLGAWDPDCDYEAFPDIVSHQERYIVCQSVSSSHDAQLFLSNRGYVFSALMCRIFGFYNRFNLHAPLVSIATALRTSVPNLSSPAERSSPATLHCTMSCRLVLLVSTAFLSATAAVAHMIPIAITRIVDSLRDLILLA